MVEMEESRAVVVVVVDEMVVVEFVLVSLSLEEKSESVVLELVDDAEGINVAILSGSIILKASI